MIYLSSRQSFSEKREPILPSTFSANEWAWEIGARSKLLYDKIADIPEMAESSSIHTKYESSSLTHKALTMGPSTALLPWLSAYCPAWPLPKAVKKLLLLHPLFSPIWRCQRSICITTKLGNLQNANPRIWDKGFMLLYIGRVNDLKRKKNKVPEDFPIWCVLQTQVYQ